MAGAEGQTVLQFVPSQASASARVHPVVLFNICDSFVRRPDQAERVIGTLLGYIAPDGTVEIRNSYAVPHNESSDQVLMFLLACVMGVSFRALHSGRGVFCLF